MKRPARLAILIFGLLALLAPAAEADPPNLPVSGVTAVPSVPPVVAVPAPVNLPSVGGGIPSAAESGVHPAGDPMDEKEPARNDVPAVPALGTTTVESSPSRSGNPGNNATSGSAVANKPAAPLDRTPPDNVQGLKAKAGDRAVTLRWIHPADADFNHVAISRTPQTAEPAETTVYNGPATRFVDRRVTNGVAYRYVIVSYDRTGNRSAGVAIMAAPKALMLVGPSDGARVKAPPLLRWVWIPGATFYNVQLFRGPTRIKVMTAWPAANRLQLSSRWVYAGHRHRLVPGIYRWVVWPGFGRQMAKKYGPLLGEGTFTVVAGKPACAARGVACSQALAADTLRTEPPIKPTRTASESPLATARGPVVTVPSTPATTVPALEPDLLPVQGERAPGPKPAPAQKSAPVLSAAPARKPAPAPKAASVRRTAEPSNRAPVRTASGVAGLVRGRAPAAQPFATSRASAPAEKSQPLHSFAPRAAPSGIKQGLARLRWFLLAVLGTGVVFLAAVGSRRLSERRSRNASSLRWRPPAAPPSATRQRAAQERAAPRAVLNGAPQGFARNGTVQAAPLDTGEPLLSRRRCLVPGCHHEDQLPAGHRHV